MKGLRRPQAPQSQHPPNLRLPSSPITTQLKTKPERRRESEPPNKVAGWRNPRNQPSFQWKSQQPRKGKKKQEEEGNHEEAHLSRAWRRRWCPPGRPACLLRLPWRRRRGRWAGKTLDRVCSLSLSLAAGGVEPSRRRDARRRASRRSGGGLG